MWQAIAQVTTGFTLAAFVAAAIAWVIRTNAQERERLIRSAKPEDLANLVRDALEFFHVDTARLTREQQFNIAIKQIQERARRFQTIAMVVCFIAVITSLLAAFAIYNSKEPGSSQQNAEDARKKPPPQEIEPVASAKQPTVPETRQERYRAVTPPSSQVSEGVGAARLELQALEADFKVELFGTATAELAEKDTLEARIFVNGETTPCNSVLIPRDKKSDITTIKEVSCNLRLKRGTTNTFRLDVQTKGTPKYSRITARFENM